MDTSGTIKSQLDLARNVHDMGSINRLRSAANANEEGALQEAAQQFEAIFVNMLLKSMRKAQEALADEDSPFNSQQVKFYRDMHDQQLATDLAGKGTLGLAEIIVRQLGNESLVQPQNGIRTDGSIADYNRERSNMVRRAEDAMLPTQSAYKASAFSSPEDFVEQLYPLAAQHAQALGIDPKALIAQAAVETGWGQHMIHKPTGENAFNLFGIKADKRWHGEKATVPTIEYENDIATQQKAQFRAYPSFAQSMQDYVQFVQQNPRYEAAIEQAADLKQYFEHLQQSGYATDPNYAQKVLSVLQSPVLRDFVGSE